MPSTGDIVDGRTHYVATNPIRIEPRPAVQPPLSPQIAGWSYDLSTLPLGTVVTVRNEVGDELVITDLLEALTLVSAVFQASWAIKDNPAGIPANYTADEYWP